MAADDKMDTSGAPGATAAAAEEAPKKPATPTLEDLKKNVALLERAVQTTQLRLIGRILRNNTPFRRSLPPAALAEAVKHFVPADEPLREHSLRVLAELPSPPVEEQQEQEAPAAPSGEAMEVEGGEGAAAGAAAAAKAPAKAPKPPLQLPESTVYLVTLAVTTALRLGRQDLATELVTALLGYVRKQNRRTLDPLAAKAVFYLALCYERAGKLAELRPLLVALHRTACLRHDEMGQATVLNLLLRSLLADNLIEQASNLVARTAFPEGASNNQLCRYLYYVGRIQALQLDYTDAHTKLMQASRKAPADTALGFRRVVAKLSVIVQLLLGDIPERSLFDQPDLKAALGPYLNLTNAVRHGDLLEFERTVSANAALFKADRTHTLILRLGHNVIKTGLRKISLSYSRISLADIAAKLHLDGPASAEFVCAKAIKDGVIDALLDHEQGFLQSREVNDLYATSLEPQQAFHKRITFCLDVHNEAVKSMRFPQAPGFKEQPGDRLGENDKTDEELAKEIESDLEDEF